RLTQPGTGRTRPFADSTQAGGRHANLLRRLDLVRQIPNGGRAIGVGGQFELDDGHKAYRCRSHVGRCTWIIAKTAAAHVKNSAAQSARKRLDLGARRQSTSGREVRPNWPEDSTEGR